MTLETMMITIEEQQVQGSNLPDCARLATAFSLGAITRIGPRLPAPDVLQTYFQRVSIYILADVPRSVS
jgi:1-phosphofructokinase